MADTLIIPDYPNEQSVCFQIGEYWYDEITGDTYTVRTMLHPVLSGSNYKIFYPEISKFNIQNPDISRAYPRFDGTFTALSAYSFLGTGQQINITKVEKPLVSYNKETKTFVVTYLGSDMSGYQYLFTNYFRKKDEELTPLNIDCIKPDLDIININFTDWTRLSGEFIPTGGANFAQLGDTFNFTNAWPSTYYGISSLSSNPLSAFYARTVSEAILDDLSDPQSTGQLYQLFAGEDRTDGFNTLWLGCSSVEYLPSTYHPFPVMYNTTYILPTSAYNKTSDIEISMELAMYYPEDGLSNRAVFSRPSSGYATTNANAGFLSDTNYMSGTWVTDVTAFSAAAGSGTTGEFKPGNGFCIFFYDAENRPSDPYYPYNNKGVIPNGPPVENYTVSVPTSAINFYPQGVGSSLGYKPYSGFMQLGDLPHMGTLGLSASHFSSLSDGWLDRSGLLNGYIGVGFDAAGGFANTTSITGNSALSALSGANTICVKGADWNLFEDLTVVAPSGPGKISTSIPDITLCQQLTGTRKDALAFNTYKVSLQNFGGKILVEIKPWKSDKFYTYLDYDLSLAEQQTLASITDLRVGFSFSTSEKTATCEVRNVNLYGRYIDNPIFNTSCGETCTPTLTSDTTLDVCPISANLSILECEHTYEPIVTEGIELSDMGMNNICKNIEDTLYYGTDLQGPEGTIMKSNNITLTNVRARSYGADIYAADAHGTVTSYDEETGGTLTSD